MQASREWILRALAESTIIVVSIILALAVDEWRDDRQNQELAAQSLMIFEQEIRQNLGRVDDAAPDHAGLRDVVAGMMAGEPAEADLRSAMEGLEPVVLLNTAWETALATGVLTHHGVRDSLRPVAYLQSAAALHRDESVESAPVLRINQCLAPSVREQIDLARSYLTSLTRDEVELQTVYRQALEIIGGRTEEAAGNP